MNKVTEFKRFTEEQLSRILSHAHELERGGYTRSEGEEGECRAGCINQVAYNEAYNYVALDLNYKVGWAFDDESSFPCTPFEGGIDPDRLLAFLENLGAA